MAMKKILKWASLLLAAGLFSCNTPEPLPQEDDDDENKDLIENYTVEAVVSITYRGSVTVENPLEGQGVLIVTDGNNVVCTSTTDKLVEFRLSGDNNNASFTLYSDKRYVLTLNGIKMKSAGRPAINLQSSKRCYLVIADNTDNYLADSGTYDTDKDTNESHTDLKGVLFSEGQLVVSGNGVLKIDANNANGHAIATDEYLRMRSGNIQIGKSAKQALHIKDYWLMEGGTLTADMVNDGAKITKGYIHITGGTVNMTVNDDGILTSYGDDVANDTDPDINTDITIDGGDITIFSMKTKSSGYGIRSTGNLYLNQGTLNLTVYSAATALVADYEGCSVYRNGAQINIVSSTD